MQISSRQTANSETVTSSNPRAERLLSPSVAQLDARAFISKSSDNDTMAPKVFGLMAICIVGLAMIMANQIYQPNISPAKKFENVKLIESSPIIPKTLEVSDVELRKITINRKKIALVVGYIINRSGIKLPIPKLNIVLRQKDGQNVTSWRYRPRKTSLKAGASIRFTSQFSTDVKDGSVVEIQFVSRDDR